MHQFRRHARGLTLSLLLFLFSGSLIALPITSPSAAQDHTPGRLQVATTIFLPLLTTAPEPWVERFDGMPTNPQPWRPTDWDVSVHVRSATTAMEPMQAQHGADCGPPTETHTINRLDRAVYLCRNHLMTALNASDYGVIYLTPNQVVDFSQGEAVISWDMSTLRTSGRDWIDLWITPYADHLPLPLQEWLPDLNGAPREAIHIFMDFNTSNFKATLYRNFEGTDISGANSGIGYEQFLTPDAARRDTFEVRISTQRLQVGMPDYNFHWIDRSIPELEWTQGVVQFGHHSYNPTKDCSSSCGPATWHWDNIAIAPSQPFTIIPANQLAATQAAATATFPKPAPTGGKLRFTAVGRRIEVSFDGGATWQAAQMSSVRKQSEGTFNPYFTNIPAGTTSVRFRGQNWYGGGWMVRNPSIWAPPNS